jgi:uncharacterized membrane protein YhaH (DUF805 family)
MFLSTTPEVRVESFGSDVSYLFPPRPLGALRWFGLVLVAFSVLFIWGPAHSLFDSFKRLHDPQQSGQGFEIVSVIGLLIFVTAGCIPGALGFLIAFGRCRVDWRNQRLSVLEYAGPIRWRRRFPKNPVRKFTVNVGGAEITNRPVTSGPLADLGALTAEFESGAKRVVMLGYPRDWLRDLAEDLSTHVGASISSVNAPPVEVVDARENQPQFADVSKPADTDVKIESRAGGLTVEVPPTGLRKVSKGMLTFGVVWCLFLTVFTIVGFNSRTFFQDPLPDLLIVVFWLVGIALIVSAVNMARRRATLQVESGSLSVTQTGLFGTKRREWRRGDIAAVRADASGMEVNNRPVIELQIHPVTGRKAGFFAGRDAHELRWVATELRKALAVPAKTE